MCPVDSTASCSNPKALSCTFRGCGPLPEVPASKTASLSYLGTPERSLAGGSTSLLCRAETERRLTVTLASSLNPDNIIILDQELVDNAKEESDIPDWCPSENCFATGRAAFKVEDNEEEMSNCFTGGYRSKSFLPTMFASQPRCAKADSIVLDEDRGFVWESSGAYENCIESNGQPCPHRVPKGCPVTDCIHKSFRGLTRMCPESTTKAARLPKRQRCFQAQNCGVPKKVRSLLWMVRYM